jgi:hypothetical protein
MVCPQFGTSWENEIPSPNCATRPSISERNRIVRRRSRVERARFHRTQRACSRLVTPSRLIEVSRSRAESG